MTTLKSINVDSHFSDQDCYLSIILVFQNNFIRDTEVT